MRPIALLLLAVVLVAGCGGEKASTTQEGTTTTTPEAAGGPNLITVSNQTEIWQCPTCGMTFDGPGECSMKDGTLVKMNVRYVCPTGGEALPGVGKCPTHGVDARVEKTVASTGTPADTTVS